MLKRNKDQFYSLINTRIAMIDKPLRDDFEKRNRDALAAITATKGWLDFVKAAAEHQDAAHNIGVSLPPASALLPPHSYLTGPMVSEMQEWETKGTPIKNWFAATLAGNGYRTRMTSVSKEVRESMEFLALDLALDMCRLPWDKFRPFLFGLAMDLSGAKTGEECVKAIGVFLTAIK